MEIVKIKPNHFINSEGYLRPFNCPLALALNDHFGKKDCSAVIGIAYIDGKDYKADIAWHSRTNLFKGTVYQGMSVDEAIQFAKENPNAELPTIEVWVDYY